MNSSALSWLKPSDTEKSLVRPESVVHLAAPAVFEAMLDGLAAPVVGSLLTGVDDRIEARLIRWMADFTGLIRWQWTPAEGEAFIDRMRGGESPVTVSTARIYEVTISLLVEFLLDSRYGWVPLREERFGATPQPVFYEGNSVVVHKVEYEGDPQRRSLTYDEVQALFDAAHARPGRIGEAGVTGTVYAARDARAVGTLPVLRNLAAAVRSRQLVLRQRRSVAVVVDHRREGPGFDLRRGSAV